MLRFLTDKFRTPRKEPLAGPCPLPARRGTEGGSPLQPFSPDLQAWVEDGVRFGLASMEYWAGCRRGAGLLTLSSVPDSLRDELADAKVLGMLHGVLFTRAADCCVDGDVLNKFTDLPRPVGCERVVIKEGMIAAPRAEPRDFNASTGFESAGKSLGSLNDVPEEDLDRVVERKRIGDFAAAIREEFADRVRRLPRYGEFVGMLRYDRRRYFDTIRNAHRLAGGEAGRQRRQFDPTFAAADHLLVSTTMDAMGSPDFDSVEIGSLREVIWRAQFQFRKHDLATAWEVGGDSAPSASEGLRLCRKELLLAQPTLQSVDLGRLAAGLEELAGGMSERSGLEEG